MRVVVTGGSGKIGRAAIRALRAAGHRTISLDQRPPVDGSRFVLVDLSDAGQALDALGGVDAIGGPPDAVVHLAGIPAPGLSPDQLIFRNNTLSTYNVFHACRRLGIRRIVWASSETLLGLPFETPPDFAPIDESHPVRPEWSYALSKQIGEAMADAFARWSPPASIASLRFSNVFEPHEYEVIAAIQARPDARRFNLWSYVDARDAGEACRLALEASFTGHEPMIIAAADTLMKETSAELMSTWFPDTPLRGPIADHQSLLSSGKAERLIGYSAQHSWRSA